jgi:putative serine protease PepD
MPHADRPAADLPESANPDPRGTSTSTSPALLPADARADGPPAYPAQPRPRRPRSILGAVVGAAVLSAVLASGSTFALVSLTTPAPSATPVPATGQTVVAQASGSYTDADITSIVATARESVVTVTSTLSSGGIRGSGIGSGIVLSANGYILTNRHVIEGAQSLSVQLLDGTVLPARIVQVAQDNDLALIKADGTGLTPAKIGNSSDIQVGETALAIGSPLGQYTETVTKGIISATGRDITVRDEQTGQPTTLHGLIQTDAAVNQGNSGGPLLDDQGDVVGINTAVSAQGQGLGFAIPIDAARSLIAIAHSSST